MGVPYELDVIQESNLKWTILSHSSNQISTQFLFNQKKKFIILSPKQSIFQIKETSQLLAAFRKKKKLSANKIFSPKKYFLIITLRKTIFLNEKKIWAQLTQPNKSATQRKEFLYFSKKSNPSNKRTIFCARLKEIIFCLKKIFLYLTARIC